MSPIKTACIQKNTAATGELSQTSSGVLNPEERSQAPTFKGRADPQWFYIFFFSPVAPPIQTDKEQTMEEKFGWFSDYLLEMRYEHLESHSQNEH